MEDKVAECKSRAMLYGLSTGSIVFATFFLVQKVIMKDMKKSRNFLPFIIGTSFAFAGTSSYLGL